MSNSSSNKINKRLQNTESNLKKSISGTNNKNIKNNGTKSSLFDKFTNLSDSFKNNFKSNKNNKPNLNNNLSNNTNNNSKDASAFDNMNVLIVLLCITVFFIVYGVYLYLRETKYHNNSTFYGEDLTSYKPLFKLNTDKIDKCIERCNKDVQCDGVTFNREIMNCVGSEKGILRQDSEKYVSWLKKKKNNKNKKVHTITGLIKSQTLIKQSEIPLPKNPNAFNYSFYLYINDFYHNHGKWRHVFHKGTEIIESNTHNWEDILRNYPDQGIGVWLSPFNNNMRIALTTRTTNLKKNYKVHKHPFEQKYKESDYDKEKNCPKNVEIYISDKTNNPHADMNRYGIKKIRALNNDEIVYEKNLEFIDIHNMPIKKLTHFSINLIDTNLEIYMNGKITNSFSLQGYPLVNEGHFYSKYPTTFDGSIVDLKFSPNSINIKDVTEIISNTDNVSEAFKK